MQQCIQPTGTNRPRAWRSTRSCSLWNAQGLRKRSLRRGLPVQSGGRASPSARFPVAMAAGKHPFPFRTRQLSPPAPMVLGGRPPGRVGRRRDFSREPPRASARGGLVRSGPRPTQGGRPRCGWAWSWRRSSWVDGLRHEGRATSPPAWFFCRDGGSEHGPPDRGEVTLTADT